MLRELRTFVAVARQGSFAAAGQVVGLTPSAVSAQIRNLEAELGIRLFDRTGRTAILNMNGKKALGHAEEILAVFARMMEVGDGVTLRGELKVGAIGTVQTGLLPDAMVMLQKRAPALRIHLVPGVSLTLLNQVDAGEIDLALVVKPPFALQKDLHAEDIVREEFALITPTFVSETDPLEILANYPFIRYDRSSFAGRQVAGFLNQHGIVPDQILELDEIEAIVRMVQGGLGVSVIPLAGDWAVNPDRLRVRHLGPLTFHRTLQAVVRYAQRAAPAVTVFLDCVRQAVSDRPQRSDAESAA
jgi:DNA-binding transcriptional LysR family regulator